MNVNRKEREISKEVFNKKILQNSNENTEISETMKKKSDSGNDIQTLSKVNQNKRKSLSKLRKISKTMSVN